MTNLQKQFFELVRSGLWGTPADASLFDEQTDWQQLYLASRKQTLLGIVLDGVQTLPPEKRPKRMLYLQWCNALMQIEENNSLLNRELAQVYALYRANGIEPVLLKGQGVAQNYRIPLHRQCGDIDLYLGDRHYDTANRLLREEGTDTLEENYQHTCIRWHGISIENHRVIATLKAPGANRRFQKEVERWHDTLLCRQIEIGGTRVTVAPLSFEAGYLLVHSVLHFLNEGIGLRQVCDWVTLLRAHREELDKKEVARLFREWGLTEAAKVFGVLATRYLGLSEEELPVPYAEKDIATGEWLLSDIWQGGNFGQHDDARAQRPKGYWSGKWHTFSRISKRCRELGALAPAEARWFPVSVTLQSIEMQWKKLRK